MSSGPPERSLRNSRKKGFKLSNPRKLFMKKPVFQSLNSDVLPRAPASFIEALGGNEKYLRTEGIFRIPGSGTDIANILKQCQKRGRTVDLEPYNVHTIACCLKQWIRDMEDPLLTFELFTCWLECSKLKDEKQHIVAAWRCLGALPKSNRALVHALFSLLKKVESFSEDNKMTAKNLAIVFSPTVLRPEVEMNPLEELENVMSLNKVIKTLIVDFDRFFDENGLRKAPPLLKRQVTDDEQAFFDAFKRGGARMAKTIIVEQQKQSMAKLVANREPSRAALAASEWTNTAAPQENTQNKLAGAYKIDASAPTPPPLTVSQKAELDQRAANFPSPQFERRKKLATQLSTALSGTGVPELSKWEEASPHVKRRRLLSQSRDNVVGVSLADILDGILAGETDTVQDYLAEMDCAEIVDMHSDLRDLTDIMANEEDEGEADDVSQDADGQSGESSAAAEAEEEKEAIA